MTLSEIITALPDLFYQPYTAWYEGEPFMETEPRPLSEYFWTSTVQPHPLVIPIQAVDLAALYVKNPGKEVWRKFLWTDDVDRWGNRVYVGGVGQYGIDAFQIHRKLEPEAYWVQANG